jgi:flagellar hook-associated protein 2
MSSIPPITLSGFSSGIPVDQIISQLMSIERRPITGFQQQISRIRSQDSVYNSINQTAVKIQSGLQALTQNTVSSPDLFARKTATSTTPATATASVDNSAAAPQTLSLTVNSVATATQATTQAASFGVGVGQAVAMGTNINAIFPKTISSGTLTLFRNGSPINITVTNTSTLSSLNTAIQTATGGNTTLTANANGALTLTDSGGATISLGGSADTSNFADITGLKFATPGTSISGKNLTRVDLNTDVTTAGANLNTVVTAGSTFTIGTSSFTVGNKSLNTLINEINNSAGAGVTISYNSSTNKMEMISKQTGSQYVNMSNTSGNFLTAMGLIVGGNSTTSQTRGSNASFVLNGSTIQSASNSVTSDITGVAGLTLNLISGAGSTTNINIASDKAPLTDNINTFITDFNALIASIDTNTNGQTGALAGDSALIFFRNNLRRTLADRTTDPPSPYQSLSSIGISTGAVTGTSSFGTSLVLDATKLNTALETNPDAVRELMIGTNGIMTRVKSLIDSAVKDAPQDTEDGLFPARTSSSLRRIDQLNRTIERAEARLLKKEELLRRQYTAMESAISRFRSQGNALAGLSTSAR